MFGAILLAFGAFARAVSAGGAQVPQVVGNFEVYNAGLFAPVGDLHSLSTSAYVTLRHPLFPGHSVRIKQSQVCDEVVHAYTGYIDIGPRHLFFYFFESRRDPDSDDVVMWTNGGPGGSSATGLFMELGPCRMAGPNATERFRYSWNERANIFFVDQPAGVGFSYTDYDGPISTTQEAGKDIAAFVAIFFEHFTKLKGRAFHMAGESYAGRYLPVFASTIYDQNPALVEAGMSAINLSSVMIGNGGPNFFENLFGTYEMRCTEQGFLQFPSGVFECIQLKQVVAWCKRGYKQACVDTHDELTCGAVFGYCMDALMEDMFRKFNPYDGTRPCKENPGAYACYPDLVNIEAYLNDPKTQSLLGVNHPRNYSFTNWEINLAFSSSADFYSFAAEDYLAALLERGVRVLMYVGTNDLASSWIAVQRTALAMEWSAQEVHRTAPVRDWHVDGEVAGWLRSGGGLTFATLYGAGHLVPFDQPSRALHMANHWLADEEF